jgi:hypothetical protein
MFLVIEKISFWKSSIRWSAPMAALFVARNHANAAHSRSFADQETPLPILLLLLLNSTDRNIRGREDGIVFDMFVVCRNIFSREKIPREDIRKPCLLDFYFFLLRRCNICKLGAQSYFASYLREK